MANAIKGSNYVRDSENLLMGLARGTKDDPN